MATYAICDRVLVDTAGNVVSSAQIEVRLLPGATLATIYSGRSGGAKTNPIVLTASDAGRVKFHAAGGAYRLTNLLTGDVWDYVAIGTGAEVDSDAFVLSSQIRPVLTAARTYYVRTDGSDSNTGLANTSGGAFLTLQKAIDTVAGLDRSIYDVTITVGAGTFTAGMTINGWGPGSGTVTVNGAGATTIISTTSARCLALLGAALTLTNVKMTTGGSGLGAVFVAFGGKLIIGSVEFGAVASGTPHIHLEQGARLDVSANYTISGGAGFHIYARYNATAEIYSRTITLSGTPAFASNYLSLSSGAVVEHGSCTFSGSATGSRYAVWTNAVFSGSGGSPTYLPGNSAGSVSSGGQYS